MPYPDTEGILLEARDQPVCRVDKFLPPRVLARAVVLVVISQSPLFDGDGVVLAADFAAVVEQRNAALVAMSHVVGLLGERHVVLAQFSGNEMRRHLRRVVPET